MQIIFHLDQLTWNLVIPDRELYHSICDPQLYYLDSNLLRATIAWFRDGLIAFFGTSCAYLGALKDASHLYSPLVAKLITSWMELMYAKSIVIYIDKMQI